MSGLTKLGKFRRPLIAVAATCLLLEIASFTALKAMEAYPENSFLSMYRSSSCLKANEFNYGERARETNDLMVMLAKLPHPFFGITDPAYGFNRGRVGPDYARDIRYRVQLGEDPRPRDTFTIGVLGASVADSLARYLTGDEEFRRILRENIPWLRDARIEIRNLAIGSSRQPSQLAVATMYMELLDMTINVDGWSEIAVVQHPEFPIEYPMFSDVFYSGAERSVYLKMLAGEQVCFLMSLTPTILRPLAYSNLYYLLWQSVSKRMNRALYVKEPPERSAESEFTIEQELELYARYFQRYTRFQHQLLTANGVKAYFFLQPNQYVPSSKPFSEKEKRIAFGNDQAEGLAASFALLRSKVGELRGEGVLSFDLTQVYSDVTDTVYIDNCCHVNALGNQLMAERIADIIVESETGRSFPPELRAGAR